VSLLGFLLLFVGASMESSALSALAWGVLILGAIPGLVAGTVLFATGQWADEDLWLHLHGMPSFPRFWAHLRGSGDRP
jgi:hypothetical protein